MWPGFSAGGCEQRVTEERQRRQRAWIGEASHWYTCSQAIRQSELVRKPSALQHEKIERGANDLRETRSGRTVDLIRTSC